MGLGTLSLNASPRLVILWSTLLGLWLAYREGQSIRVRYEFVDVGRGIGIGLILGLPLLLLSFRVLTTAIPILYVSVDDPSISGVGGTTIFVSLVLLAPLAESLFFHDVVQKERGFWIATVFYAVACVILFLPTAGRYPVVLAAVSGISAILGGVYGLLYDRFNMTTSLAFHSTVNLLLLFMPALLSHLDLFTR
jgi:hypothetical protein